ncbi:MULTISPECIES: plasmid replication protein RepC [unclassified Shinella]|uniref:plasmid replication protein RepC n=1 Tax=unclassified Shinella TaxID=2643062 RepID=UPI00234EED5F|nr:MULTISPECIES: plasmid replication protein RepC [unclassified Shinella]MCO5153985.1 replication initiation protein RepC [Shinella sp.]MDC7266905.1 replication initiation protein RepC [Shinella sp. HY16]MDC7273802.1 replication initiation protein RepC [Shinella sp. YZ44]
MQIGRVTTPHGRPMTLALVKGQLETADRGPSKAVNKWKVFNDVGEAKDVFGLQDRSLTVLQALLSFYPSDELCDESGGLVVFPSNSQLSMRAHGIAGTTLRRHLAALVDAGLIERRDSPNGKRYAHRGRGGEIEAAYGFSLAPLLARAAELANLAHQVAAERLRFKRAKEALSLCRRDVRKLISAAMEEGANGDWATIETMFIGLMARLPRSPRREDVDAVLEEMELLREEIINRLEIQVKAQKTDVNDRHDGCHIQNSKSESFHELEPSSEKEQGEMSSQKPKRIAEPLKAFPLSLVLRACPQIADYAVGGRLETWRELMATAVLVRSVLGVSPSAYEEACAVMGPESAAIAVACILERAEHITSPGGYLRDLTRKAARGEFGLGPMLMAALRANGADEKRRA